MSEAEENPSAVVTKNPKRVAAGKKLAERNKMYKEHFKKTSSVRKTELAETAHTSNDTSTNYYVIGAIVLAAAGIMYYQSKPATSRPPPPRPVEEPAAPKPSRLIKM